MIVDIDVAYIDNEKQDSFLWKIATRYTWDDHWKNGFNDKRRYEWVSINQFSSLTGKKNTGLRQWPLILASLHAESIFPFLCRKRIKYPNTDTTGQVNVFLFFFLSIATLCVGPLKNFGFNHHAYNYYHKRKNNILKENYIR